MAGEVGIDLERNIGAGADFKDCSGFGEPCNETGILDCPHAMPDAGWFDEIECIGHAFRPANLAGMNGQSKAGIACDIEGARIIGDAAHTLLARHVEPRHQRMLGARRIFGRGDHPLRTEVPLACDDDAGFDTRLVPCNPDAFGNAGQISVGAKPDAVAMVGRNDQFAIDRIGFREFGQIGLGENGIILIRLEHLCHRIITTDEFGEIRP